MSDELDKLMENSIDNAYLLGFAHALEMVIFCESNGLNTIDILQKRYEEKRDENKN